MYFWDTQILTNFRKICTINFILQKINLVGFWGRCVMLLLHWMQMAVVLVTNMPIQPIIILQISCNAVIVGNHIPNSSNICLRKNGIIQVPAVITWLLQGIYHRWGINLCGMYTERKNLWDKLAENSGGIDPSFHFKIKPIKL